MEKILFKMKESTFLSPSQQPPYFFAPPQPTIDTNRGAFDLSSRVSPSILLIIIILAIIFFVSGLLHLLVRSLQRPPNRDSDDLESVTALQGQLQQLFNLHDAGVDQSFIDTLPVFSYKAIIGLKDPFDCAVCLCEFEGEDKLRLLPKCSHAFHKDCIDTWLLAHSTCPLCRASLLSDFSPNNTSSPVFLVLESCSESSREIVNDGDCNFGRSSSVLTAHSHLGSQRDFELGSTKVDYLQKSGEMSSNKDEPVLAAVVNSGEKVVAVKLGKFRDVDIGEGCSSNYSVDSRRCYSMESFEYVMDENSPLQVPIRTPIKKQSSKKPSLPLTPGHRPAMSECDYESKREFSGFEGLFRSGNTELSNNSITNPNSIIRTKRESFSISKIWLRSKNEKQKPAENSSRRAASFRFPLSKNVVAEDDLKEKNNVNGIPRRTTSEIGGESGRCDVENHGSCNISLDSQPKTPSFARRTLNWLVGKQNKVVHSSFATPED